VAAIAKLKMLNETKLKWLSALQAHGLLILCSFSPMGPRTSERILVLPVHDAFFCVELTEAGMLASTGTIEGENGLLHAYSGEPDYEGLCDKLGTDWLSLQTSIKLYPACRMNTLALGPWRNSSKFTAARKSSNSKSKSNPCFTALLVSRTRTSCIQSINHTQFSMHYQTTAAWLLGCDHCWRIYDYLTDKTLYNILDRVKVVQDPHSTLRLGCEITARFNDGTEVHLTLKEPSDELSNPITRQQFNALAPPFKDRAVVADLVQNLEHIDDIYNVVRVLQ
jgi:2-methylcitrate dehydratase PrpD